MQTAIYSWFGYFQPFEERIEMIQEAGFDRVLLAWEDEREPKPISIFDQVKRARALGLEVENAHAPYAGWNLLWDDDRDAAKPLMADLKRWIREVGDSGIPSLVVHTTDIEVEKPINVDNGLRNFEELLRTAEDAGTSLAVENVSRQYLLRKIFENLESPALRFCYDSSHDFMLPCCRGKILHDYKDKLITTHISDNNLYRDCHWIPGEGKIDYGKILPDLKASPIDCLSLEVLHPQDDPRKPEEFLADAYKAAKNLTDRITAI